MEERKCMQNNRAANNNNNNNSSSSSSSKRGMKCTPDGPQYQLATYKRRVPFYIMYLIEGILMGNRKKVRNKIYITVYLDLYKPTT